MAQHLCGIRFATAKQCAACAPHPCCAAWRVQAAASSYTPPAPPFNVVITGGSKGVGRALAAEFLKVSVGEGPASVAASSKQQTASCAACGAKRLKGSGRRNARGQERVWCERAAVGRRRGVRSEHPEHPACCRLPPAPATLQAGDNVVICARDGGSEPEALCAGSPEALRCKVAACWQRCILGRRNLSWPRC